MLIDMELTQLPTPSIELGAPSTFTDPKTGLTKAGPFDRRFGANTQKRNACWTCWDR